MGQEDIPPKRWFSKAEKDLGSKLCIVDKAPAHTVKFGDCNASLMMDFPNQFSAQSFASDPAKSGDAILRKTWYLSGGGVTSYEQAHGRPPSIIPIDWTTHQVQATRSPTTKDLLNMRFTEQSGLSRLALCEAQPPVYQAALDKGDGSGEWTVEVRYEGILYGDKGHLPFGEPGSSEWLAKKARNADRNRQKKQASWTFGTFSKAAPPESTMYDAVPPHSRYPAPIPSIPSTYPSTFNQPLYGAYLNPQPDYAPNLQSSNQGQAPYGACFDPQMDYASNPQFSTQPPASNLTDPSLYFQPQAPIPNHQDPSFYNQSGYGNGPPWNPGQ